MLSASLKIFPLLTVSLLAAIFSFGAKAETTEISADFSVNKSERQLERFVLSLAEKSQSARDLADIFEASGFTVRLHGSLGQWPSEPPYTLFAICTLGDTCPFRMRSMRHLFGRWMSRSYSIDVTYSEGDVISSVQTTINWE